MPTDVPTCNDEPLALLSVHSLFQKLFECSAESVTQQQA